MAVDYTVILSVRQRFGDNREDTGQFLMEAEAPFVGESQDFPFSCPNVDRSQPGILQFESLGVQFRQFLQINGHTIFGGITAGPDRSEFDPVATPRALWKTHSLIVHENVLLDQNVLHIKSQVSAGGNFDDFIIDNVVVFFKTRRPGPIGEDVLIR